MRAPAAGDKYVPPKRVQPNKAPDSSQGGSADRVSVAEDDAVADTVADAEADANVCVQATHDSSAGNPLATAAGT